MGKKNHPNYGSIQSKDFQLQLKQPVPQNLNAGNSKHSNDAMSDSDICSFTIPNKDIDF